MVKQIAAKLGDVDAANQKSYEDQAAAYVSHLEELRRHGLARLKGKGRPRIITTHDSLRYFARAYGLEVVGSIRPRPGIEADAGKLAELVKACKKQEVQAILVEPQYSTGAAEAAEAVEAGRTWRARSSSSTRWRRPARGLTAIRRAVFTSPHEAEHRRPRRRPAMIASP